MLIDKLKSLENPTFQEKHIIEFLLGNPNIVNSLSSIDLARMTYTSPSTITRLCKKVGTKGYPDFKIKWIQEYLALESNIYANTNKDLVEKSSTVASTLEEMPKVYNKIIYETSQLIDPGTFQYCLQLISKANFIAIYGANINNDIARSASYKLSTLGIVATVFSSLNSQFINMLAKKKTKNAVSFIISHTGANPEMLLVAQKYQQNHLPYIAMSGSRRSPLAKGADAVIELYCTPNVFTLSNIAYSLSLNYIFDLFYTCLMVRDYDFQAKNAIENFMRFSSVENEG